MLDDPVARPAGHADAATHLLLLKRRLAKVHRIITAGGLWPLTKGHVSARVPGANRVLILGHIHSLGRTLDTVSEDDLCLIDLDGVSIEGRVKPVGERFIHTAILQARPDVDAVIHCHSTYATAFGIAGVNILPVGNRGGIFAPSVPILDFEGQIDTPERGAIVRDAIGRGYALVLKNHGVVVVGGSVEKACIVAFALEETARLQWIASTLGTPQRMSDVEAQRVLGPENEEYFTHVWQHYEKMDPLAGR